MVQLTVADYLAQFLAKKKVPAAYQLSGGMIAFLTDAIENLGATPLIHNRHEQASGFAAEGSTRVTGIPSVAMGTSGPGATNLVTPIASCFFDSVPVIFITGQVRTDEIKKSGAQRQNGFQELDICEVVKPITKRAWKVTTSVTVPQIMEEAWELATNGRPGPVLIDLPIDIQQQMITVPSDYAATSKNTSYSEPAKSQLRNIAEVVSLIEKAQNPLVLVGGGVRTAGALNQLHAFLAKSKMPHVSTLMGLDASIHDSENYLGFIGSYGNRWANEALSKSDLLLVLGSRLDVRQTGANIEGFKRNKTIIRVDIDVNELEGRVSSDLAITANLQSFLTNLNQSDINIHKNELVDQTRVSKINKPQNTEQDFDLYLNPNDVLEKISETYSESNGYIVDVGQHQMWAAQSIHLSAGQRFLTSGGLGAMGFALPASIGAALSKKGDWVTILGDGCIQLSIQELQTISQYGLPITICIINNNQHGMVAQFQEENMNSRFIGTRDGFSNPDFSKIAGSFGINNYLLVKTPNDLSKLNESIEKFTDGPSLIEFVIEQEAKALPKMKFSND
jgi:acetolactate synthase-1/2/3 large subunit